MRWGTDGSEQTDCPPLGALQNDTEVSVKIFPRTFTCGSRRCLRTSDPTKQHPKINCNWLTNKLHSTVILLINHVTIRLINRLPGFLVPTFPHQTEPIFSKFHPVHTFTNCSSVINFTVILLLRPGMPSGVFVGGFRTLTLSFHTSHSRPFICPINSSCKSKLQVCSFLQSFRCHSQVPIQADLYPHCDTQNLNRTVTVHKLLLRRFDRCVLPAAFNTALTSTHPGYTNFSARS